MRINDYAELQDARESDNILVDTASGTYRMPMQSVKDFIGNPAPPQTEDTTGDIESLIAVKDDERVKIKIQDLPQRTPEEYADMLFDNTQKAFLMLEDTTVDGGYKKINLWDLVRLAATRGMNFYDWSVPRGANITYINGVYTTEDTSAVANIDSSSFPSINDPDENLMVIDSTGNFGKTSLRQLSSKLDPTGMKCTTFTDLKIQSGNDSDAVIEFMNSYGNLSAGAPSDPFGDLTMSAFDSETIPIDAKIIIVTLTIGGSLSLTLANKINLVFTPFQFENDVQWYYADGVVYNAAQGTYHLASFYLLTAENPTSSPTLRILFRDQKPTASVYFSYLNNIDKMVIMS